MSEKKNLIQEGRPLQAYRLEANGKVGFAIGPAVFDASDAGTHQFSIDVTTPFIVEASDLQGIQIEMLTEHFKEKFKESLN